MGIGRFALPLALGGVAAGILASDLGIAPALPLLVAGLGVLAIGALIGPKSMLGGGLLLVGVILGLGGVAVPVDAGILDRLPAGPRLDRASALVTRDGSDLLLVGDEESAG